MLVALARVWKPVPAMVTLVPPAARPTCGVTLVTVTAGAAAVTVTLADLESEQPAAVVTVTLSVSVPAAPAVKLTAFVPFPEVMVPLVIDQLYVAPLPALATLAEPRAPAAMVETTEMVAFGSGLTVTVVAAEVSLQRFPLVTVTVYEPELVTLIDCVVAPVDQE